MWESLQLKERERRGRADVQLNMKQDSPEVEEGRVKVEDGERGSEDKDTGTLAEEEEVVIDSAPVEGRGED